MAESIDRISQLLSKLEKLQEKQEAFSKEISVLQKEIEVLKTTETRSDNSGEKEQVKIEAVTPDVSKNIEKENPFASDHRGKELISGSSSSGTQKPGHIKADLEKFIGENLINKVGIVITVIGVSIGAKYAIEHQLISVLLRIILGYLFGLAMLAIAIRLKNNYENFSAVLLSGAMAIIYFITYAAYNFYSLIPQGFSFVLMIIITAFTVTAAIRYDRQVIAHIGLVGAYAVPFLLSEGPNNIVVLFSYTAIINIGILVIAFKKYWKPLNYSSFIFTWLIFMFWFISDYIPGEHLGLACTFLSVFFVTFYLMFLIYKILQKEKFDFYDIILLLANSFIFYGVGYNMLSRLVSGENYLGLFTLGNALTHSIVSLVIYRQKLADKNLFYFVSGLVLIFITIAVPVQLNGNWVTLLWAGEAALLFWIGRTKGVSFYEILSYGLIFLAFFSLMHDWSPNNHILNPDGSESVLTPFLNIRFATSVLFIASLTFINSLNYNTRHQSPLVSQNELLKFVSFVISAALIIVLYFSFSIELSAYWDHAINASKKDIIVGGQEVMLNMGNPDLINFKILWLLNYTMLFVSVLSLSNIFKIKSIRLGVISLIISGIVLLAYLTIGLYTLSELRDNYLNQLPDDYYQSGLFNIVIRYISLLFVGLLFTSSKMFIQRRFVKPVSINLFSAYDIIFYTSLIWIVSSELLSWLDIMDYNQSYKLALSILWGVCSLLLISLGIWKREKHLRVGAIILFAITLIKLFFYDISHLNTISKTIVFVTLGLLLLIISFLYNKYRNLISEGKEID